MHRNSFWFFFLFATRGKVYDSILKCYLDINLFLNIAGKNCYMMVGREKEVKAIGKISIAVIVVSR
jgi:hypothetical protein